MEACTSAGSNTDNNKRAPNQASQWSIESLNKAYRQGYLWGLSGELSHQCPHDSEVMAAAWEAGWIDGYEQYELIESAHLNIA